MNRTAGAARPETILAEIVNEFTGVVGFAELLEEDETRRLEYAGHVCRSAERALGLARVLADSVRDLLHSRHCPLNEVLTELAPSLRRVAGQGLPLMVRLDPRVETIPFGRRATEALLLHLVAASRDASAGKGSIFVHTQRVDLSNGTTLACLAVEDEAGTPLAGDPRWFLLDDGPSDLMNPLTPFVHWARESGGTIRLQTLQGGKTIVTLEFPILAAILEPATPDEIR